MSESVMTTSKWGNKFWRNSKGQPHRTDGPAIEWINGYKSWYVNNEFLGINDKGFWALWDLLTPEQKQNSNLLKHLPAFQNVP